MPSIEPDPLHFHNLMAMSKQPGDDAPTPANPTKVPRPGTVPKLPQRIFNLEKRGGSAGARRARGWVGFLRFR